MAGPDFSIDVKSNDASVIVHVAGEVDVSTSPALRAALLSALGEGRRVVADLTSVTFMDSSGISALVSAHGAASEGGDQLLVVAGQPNVRKVLEITGLTELLSVHDSLDAAIA